MLSNIKNIFKVQDLRNKILFTFMIVLLYRVGTAIRVPGVDPLAIDQIKEGAQGGVLGLFNLFSGKAFTSFSIFGLGIMPYITASIIMQVLGVVIPKLEELQQEGAVGQRKITQYTATSRSHSRRCRPRCSCSCSEPAAVVRSTPRCRHRRCRCCPTASGLAVT